MKAAFLTGLRRMEIFDAPRPESCSPGEVLVRVEAVGICGSDVHTYSEGRIGGQAAKYPWIVGHECAGTVEQVGPEVKKNLRPGRRVAIDPLIVCGRCDQCTTGRRHTCRNQKFLASPGQAPGALAEYLVMPAECCFEIPVQMSMTLATLVEPVAIGIYTVGLSQIGQNDSAAVLGTGPIGLSVLLALRNAGCAKVFATDLLDYRLEFACRFGARWAGSPQQQDVVGEMLKRSPAGLDVVFECAGRQETLDQGLRLLRPGGKLMMVGIPETDRITMDIHLARRHELTFQNVRRQNECVERAIDFVSRHQQEISSMATHRFPLSRVQEAFETVAGYRDGVVKAIVEI